MLNKPEELKPDLSDKVLVNYQGYSYLLKEIEFLDINKNSLFGLDIVTSIYIRNDTMYVTDSDWEKNA
jgi:hypothetical protein